MRAFYAALFFMLFNTLKHVLLIESPPPTEPLELIAWLPKEHFNLFAKTVAGIGTFSFIFCAAYPWMRLVRITAFFSLLFIICILSSYGKILHVYHGWLTASLAFIFLPSAAPSTDTDTAKEAFESRVVQVFFIAQFASALCYAMAGFWKIRMIPSIFVNEGWTGLTKTLANSIAYMHVFHGHNMSPISLFFINYAPIGGALFLGTLALQALSPIFTLNKRLHLSFGLLIVLFHFLSEVIVRVPFRGQLYLMILFFVLSPFNKYPFERGLFENRKSF